MESYRLNPEFKPKGDQAKAIDDLYQGLNDGGKRQTLLGVTGSGKTFTMASTISKLQRPALIIAHNKTLAAQLATEFEEFLPETNVHYFVSYYDYYQPEAYVPRSDTYIEKDSSINEQIDRMRHSATRSLLLRKDVIIVASVSCIYGIGSLETYSEMTLTIEVDNEISQKDIINRLVELQYLNLYLLLTLTPWKCVPLTSPFEKTEPAVNAPLRVAESAVNAPDICNVDELSSDPIESPIITLQLNSANFIVL